MLTVSRDGDRLEVKDLNSTYGTFLLQGWEHSGAKRIFLWRENRKEACIRIGKEEIWRVTVSLASEDGEDQGQG